MDPDIYGQKSENRGLCTYENCLYLASGLSSNQARSSEAYNILPEDIQRVVKQATRKMCYVCGERGATITGQQKSCKHSFHYPCGYENGCISQFFGQYRSFCQEHNPAQTVEVQQGGETLCVICLECVGDKLSYHTTVCPNCRQAWFHRGCIQVRGPSSAPEAWQVPDKGAALTLLVCSSSAAIGFPRWAALFPSSLGIQVPTRQPAWEADSGVIDMYQRHSCCDASRCHYAQGREQAEEEGPWYLLLCSSCAAAGTHRRCSALKDSTVTWECDSCAGLGTASSMQSEPACPSSTILPTSSHSSPSPETCGQSGRPGPSKDPAAHR
ncbi:PHD finger protein 7-like [Anser cygnoides]|uniref:PHD finger protein 7-like n=1 Tax=Anser cygnoides TaxID=8845 RepID=UPI0034D2DD19